MLSNLSRLLTRSIIIPQCSYAMPSIKNYADLAELEEKIQVEKNRRNLLKNKFNVDYNELMYTYLVPRDDFYHYYHKYSDTFYSWNFVVKEWVLSDSKVREIATYYSNIDGKYIHSL